MDTIIEKIAFIATTVVTSLITYFMGKRKQQAEINSQTLENLDKSLLIYQKMINDMSIKIDELSKKIDELEGTVERLYSENKQLKSKLK